MFTNQFISKQTFQSKKSNGNGRKNNFTQRTQRLVHIKDHEDVFLDGESGYFFAYDIFRKDKVKVSINPESIQYQKTRGKNGKVANAEFANWLIDEDFKNKVKKTIKTEKENCYVLLTGVMVNGRNEIIDGETIKNVAVNWMVFKSAEKVEQNKFQTHLITATAYNAETSPAISNYQLWDLETGAIPYDGEEESIKSLEIEKNKWVDIQKENDEITKQREEDPDSSYKYPLDRGMQLRVIALEKRERLVDNKKEEYLQPVIKGMSSLYDRYLFIKNKVTEETADTDDKKAMLNKTNPEWIKELFEVIISEYGFYAYSNYTQLPEDKWNLDPKTGRDIVLPSDVIVEVTVFDEARPAGANKPDNTNHKINPSINGGEGDGYNKTLSFMAKKLTKLEPNDDPTNYLSGGQLSVFGIVEFSGDVKNQSGKVIGERNTIAQAFLDGKKKHVQERIKTSLAGKVIDGLVVAELPELDPSLLTEEDKRRFAGGNYENGDEKHEVNQEEPSFDDAFVENNIF